MWHSNFFFDLTASIRRQQRFQIPDLFPDLFPVVRIADQTAFQHPFDDHILRMDVAALFDRRLRRFKWLMRDKKQTVRIINERIACDPGFFLVRL